MGLVALVPFVLAAVPAALLARSQSKVASTLTCATGPGPARCWGREAHVVGWAEAPCDGALGAFDRFTSAGEAFSRPVIIAMTAEGPELPMAATGMFRAPPISTVRRPAPKVPTGGKSVRKSFFHDIRSAGITDPWTHRPVASSGDIVAPPPSSSFTDGADTSRAAPSATPARPALPELPTDDAGGISRDRARAMLASCVAEKTQPGEHTRTISLAIFARNELGAMLAAAAALLLGSLAMLRRRVVIDIDGETGRVEVTERAWFREVDRKQISLADLDGAVVTTGVSGSLGGRRAELLHRDGSRIPLLGSFAPFTSFTHKEVVQRIRRILNPADD